MNKTPRTKSFSRLSFTSPHNWNYYSTLVSFVSRSCNVGEEWRNGLWRGGEVCVAADGVVEDSLQGQHVLFVGAGGYLEFGVSF